MNKRTLLSLALATGIFMAWFLLLRPVFLGGDASYIVVSGSSMEPTMYTDDLVVLRQQERYGEGDAIAFYADGGVVIHRIVGGSEESGFVTRGDNRTVVDAWRPYPQHILGRTWLRIPQLGTLVQHLQAPWLLGLILGGSVGMSFLGQKHIVGRRHQRLEAARQSRVVPALRTFSISSAVLGLSALFALAFLGLAAFGFTRPEAPAPLTTSPAVLQQGDVEYSVHMDRSALYPSGVFHSSDMPAGQSPVLYRSLLRALELQFTYVLTGEAPLEVQGSYSAHLVVRAEQGWTKELELVASTPFEGQAVAFLVPVDFGSTFALLEQIEEETLYRPSAYTLTVVPTIELDGQAAATVIDADLERSFVMTVSGAQVDFGDERTNGEALDLGAEQLATEENDPSRVPGGVLAWGGVAGSVLSLTALTILTLLVIRYRTARSECDKIRRRHGRLLVDGTAQPGWNPERRLILETFEDLRRIAEREAQLVVHEQRDDNCAYLVPMANGVTAEFWVSHRVDDHTRATPHLVA